MEMRAMQKRLTMLPLSNMLLTALMALLFGFSVVFVMFWSARALIALLSLLM
jgi:hypothetical protein